jgi:hypothetical protein
MEQHGRRAGAVGQQLDPEQHGPDGTAARGISQGSARTAAPGFRTKAKALATNLEVLPQHPELILHDTNQLTTRRT